MATTELTQTAARMKPATHRTVGVDRALIRGVLPCTLALTALTAAGFLLARVDPALAPSTRPHPTLDPTPAAIAAILANNARVLAAPFILIAARFERSRLTRLAGDAITATILAGNALWIGLAIGRWEGSLIPYLPQLPLEYLAASTAAGAWIHTRRRASHRGGSDQCASAIYATATLTLLVGAAAIEVLLTPHGR
jgi:hypothetical protein